MLKKKRKLNRENNKEYIKLNNNINKYTSSLWCPNNDINLNNINTNSCFNIQKYEEQTNFINNKLDIPVIINDNLIKCKKIEMILNQKQNNIFDCWFKSYILMYNDTLKFIKNRVKNKLPLILNWKEIRTYYLKNLRDINIKGSVLLKTTNNIITFKYFNRSQKKDTRIRTHIIDTAIKLACSNYKSALTNYKNGNIKKFRIRYWKFNKPCHILEIEKTLFNNDSFLPFVFGKIKYKYNNKSYTLNSINCDCKILYEKLLNKYTLLIPEKINKEIIEHKKYFISIDPGIRTFITGISENEVIKITETKIINYINRKDKCLNNVQKSKRYKKQISSMCNRKIKNITTELHWKTINYLTNNYKNILFGNLSVKEISNNETRAK